MLSLNFIRNFYISFIIKFFGILVVFLLFNNGCSSNTGEFNKSASFLYEQIIISVADGNLEKADGYFNSLQSEHIASPLIGEALIILAKAHMDNNEHLLAGFFANEYKIRFSNIKNVDYMAFLNIEANYYAFGSYTKDQGFINDNISETSNFIALNKQNKYLPYIRHILTIFKLTQLEINKEIIRIYNIKDKYTAKEKYEQKNKELGVNDIEFIPSSIPWYVKIFSW
ncbi:outer membrane protein assembly factor BamD [Helicobacter sp. MIT 14-3879]|uniref:outer membrane protein assembly factor BamD n=1 Tax=Helicobacter sp. MIT 14-3879 TaxID=2040649 RepID=UPI000E1ECA13|nr:outer membrane protein assembly factor BamD [Helicobacter sp. MIT 14-3879]RDU65575.1 outer membrane protein assembly factor BamD [Helicobacter sp. MIT 14-3879]